MGTGVGEARDERGVTSRRLLAALVLSALLHAGAVTVFFLAQPAPPPHRVSTPVEIEIQATRPKPPKLSAPAHAALPAVAKPRQERPNLAASAPALTPTAPANPSPTAVDTAREVPHALDLTVHGGLAIASEGGTTYRGDAGPDGEPTELRSGLAQARLQGWMADDMAERLVESGRVDDWFAALGKSIEKALATDPPPPGPLKKVVSRAASEYQSAAETFGGEVSGEGEPLAVPGPTGTLLRAGGRMHTPEGAPTLWAVIEIDYRRDRDKPKVKILSSSGDATFNDHVINVVAQRLEVPGISEAGFGIHPEGTRSVWEVDGKLSFERDLKTFKLKDDAWYAPLAAATAVAGALTGNSQLMNGQVNDYRHPHIQCAAKLLRIY